MKRPPTIYSTISPNWWKQRFDIHLSSNPSTVHIVGTEQEDHCNDQYLAQKMAPNNLKIRNCQTKKTKASTFRVIKIYLYIWVTVGTSAARSFTNTDCKLQDFMASRVRIIFLFRQVFRLKTWQAIVRYVFHNALLYQEGPGPIFRNWFLQKKILHHISLLSLEQSHHVHRQNATKVYICDTAALLGFIQL